MPFGCRQGGVIWDLLHKSRELGEWVIWTLVSGLFWKWFELFWVSKFKYPIFRTLQIMADDYNFGHFFLADEAYIKLFWRLFWYSCL